MASGVYNRGKYLLATTHDWLSTAKTVMLVTSSYTPNADHNVVSDTTNELTGGSYARVALGTFTATEDDGGDYVTLDAADTVFTTLGAAAGTPKYAIVYENVGASDAARQLIAWFDLGVTPPTPTGSNYTIQWAATGLLRNV